MVPTGRAPLGAASLVKNFHTSAPGLPAPSAMHLAESITLPPYLQKLSSKVFNSCPNLKQVVVPCWSLDFNRDGDPSLEGDNVPFGDPATVTVYGYRGSPVQELAEEFGYAFSYLPE